MTQELLCSFLRLKYTDGKHHASRSDLNTNPKKSGTPHYTSLNNQLDFFFFSAVGFLAMASSEADVFLSVCCSDSFARNISAKC